MLCKDLVVIPGSLLYPKARTDGLIHPILPFSGTSEAEKHQWYRGTQILQGRGYTNTGTNSSSPQSGQQSKSKLSTGN